MLANIDFNQLKSSFTLTYYFLLANYVFFGVGAFLVI